MEIIIEGMRRNNIKYLHFVGICKLTLLLLLITQAQSVEKNGESDTTTCVFVVML